MRFHRPSRQSRVLLLSATLVAGVGAGSVPAWADEDDNPQVPLPTGQYLTPTAATGSTFQTLDPGNPLYPSFRPDGAIATALSPDGQTLLIMTSGYNTLFDAQGKLAETARSEYIFVYDVSNPRSPKTKQVLTPANTFSGLVWAPDGSKFYASGGADDQVYVYGPGNGGYVVSQTIALGHKMGNGLASSPQASGIAVSPDGSTLVVGNMFNDSVSVIDTASGTVRFEYDLRPYNTSGADGVPGGETVYGVAIKGNGMVYAASLRDREIVAVDISSGTPRLAGRVALPGSPNNILLNKAQDKLYVAQDNSDSVAVIDTQANTVLEQIDAIAPAGLLADQSNRYTGAATNNLALSPDEKTLFVTNGGANSVAIVPLAGLPPHSVAGLVPAGWYPTAVSVSADGGTMWVANNKSEQGPNPAHLTSATSRLTQTTYPGGNAAAQTASAASNQYILALEHSGLLTAPVPRAEDLTNLTLQVAANNGYRVKPNRRDEAVMSFLGRKIKHVVYIVKENRTFDQVLGDLNNGSNGDPSLTMFGQQVTPNFHRLSDEFVTLDNFFCTGEVSGNGWPWSTAGRETDFNEKDIRLNYASGGVARSKAPYDAEGTNRNVNVGVQGAPAREAARPGFTAAASALPGGAANLLPGPADDGAPDGKNGAVQRGYIWSAALRAGLTVRNYGFFIDLSRYSAAGSIPAVPLIENPAASQTQVSWAANPELIPLTDVYFRGYDNAFPDVWRYQEFKREFEQYDRTKSLPNLILLRYMHDHMGSFATAAGGVNTPETQQADNDYAVGLTAQLIANSKNYADNTLIVVVEDDAQDGPDHMDAHRSTAYVVGPYVKRHAVVSTRYSTINALRTIEDILGLEHLNLNTAYQRPMTDVFDLRQGPKWQYEAVASTLLKTTALNLAAAQGGPVRFAGGPRVEPRHDAAYWARETRGFDWSAEDRVPAGLYNQVLWEGLMPGIAYPAERTGRDMRGGAARPGAGNGRGEP